MAEEYLTLHPYGTSRPHSGVKTLQKLWGPWKVCHTKQIAPNCTFSSGLTKLLGNNNRNNNNNKKHEIN